MIRSGGGEKQSRTPEEGTYNMLSFDRLTVKAAEAIQAAAADARSRGNPEVDTAHMLGALLGQEEGIVIPVLQKIGVAVEPVRAQVTQSIERLDRNAAAAFHKKLYQPSNAVLLIAGDLSPD